MLKLSTSSKIKIVEILLPGLQAAGVIESLHPHHWRLSYFRPRKVFILIAYYRYC